MTSIFQIVVRADLFGNKETFECRTYKYEGKDTGKSFMFDGKRIAKEKLNQILDGNWDSTNAVGYSMYTLEDGIEKAKERLLQEVRNRAALKLSEVERLFALTKKEPNSVFKDKTID